MLKFYSAKRYNNFDVLYRFAQSVFFVHNRKVARISCLNILGYHGDVLICPNTQITKEYRNCAQIDGWIVSEVVRNPNDKLSGYFVYTRIV